MKSTRPDERPLGRGRVVVTGDASLPFRLLDDCDQPVAAVDDFVRELRANGNSPATCRSYSYDLLDWFRFLQAADTSWDRATRQDVRDYVLSILSADNPQRRRRRPDTPSGANRRRGATVSDRVLTVAELAEYLGVARHTVYQWRYRGEGPRGFRLGRRGGQVRYRESEVIAWLEQQRDPEPTA